MPTRKRRHQKRKSPIKGGNEAGYPVEPDPNVVMIADIQRRLDELEMNMPIHIGKVYVAMIPGGNLGQRQIPFYVPKNISKGDFMALFQLGGNPNTAYASYINLSSVYTLPNVREIPFGSVNSLFANGGPSADNDIIHGGDFNSAEERYPGLFVR